MNTKTLIKKPRISKKAFEATNETMIQEILESSEQAKLGNVRKFTTVEDFLAPWKS